MRVGADGAGIICGSRRAGLPDERFASRSEPSYNPFINPRHIVAGILFDRHAIM